MRLSAMAESSQTRLAGGNNRDLAPEEFFALLVEDEYNARKNRRLSRMIGHANFKPEQATLENVTYNQSRGFMKKRSHAVDHGDMDQQLAEHHYYRLYRMRKDDLLEAIRPGRSSTGFSVIKELAFRTGVRVRPWSPAR